MDEEWLVDPMSSHNLFITYPHINQEYVYPNSEIKPLYNNKHETINNIQSSFTNDIINFDNLIMILLTILIIFSSLIYRAILDIDKKLKLIIYKN